MVPRLRFGLHGNRNSDRIVDDGYFHAGVCASRKLPTPKVLRKDSANRGFIGSETFRMVVRWASLGRSGAVAVLQRLFSTFPHGRPGLGLLILRVAIGITALVEGILCLPVQSGAPQSVPYGQWFLCLTLILGGAGLVVGGLAPLAALVVGASFLLISFGWLPEPVGGLHEARFAGVRIVIAAVSLALLGPGAFSVDAYLFGRREIVIPPSIRPPQS
jgi:uncharacterized membrane protein YphA (DoxX/SURF4 family)